MFEVVFFLKSVKCIAVCEFTVIYYKVHQAPATLNVYITNKERTVVKLHCLKRFNQL